MSLTEVLLKREIFSMIFSFDLFLWGCRFLIFFSGFSFFEFFFGIFEGIRAVRKNQKEKRE